MQLDRRVAVAASLGAMLIGFAVLHEVLRPLQLVAMACVIVASAGSTLTAPAKTP